ncbi:ExbD/TolR family protein [Rariglobus hedericola]|uniref:Biopolymer transporter ExbD n=1 Tax=Rariglobus hedericola TaxID=2597822 RepID=A0A556QNZ3_9BACT|nr:biopolymer transporter ExbD [Rariglobus hedericola]TSJ78337.1 biopolymer transporter ExbD [Rariglobus hedericola]
MSGSFGGQSAGGAKKARIEIIPLIDVIFFLLATFVLFTLSLDKIQSVPVDLPQATPAARPITEDDLVVLQISEPGTAYWNRELISSTEIPRRLLDYKATVPAPRVLVSGDDKARYGDAVLALDEVRKAGITVSIETAFRATGR